MESMINEMAEKFKANLREFFTGEKRALAEAERYFGGCLSHIVTGLLSAYYEKLDREILEDKAEGRREGLSVERHGDKRTILTTLGEVEYDRTHYRTKERLFSALRDGDKERFDALSAEILKTSAKNAERQRDALNYLSSHFVAIHIRYANPEARNGGATEPQIQPHPFLTPFFPPYGMERNHAETSRSRSCRRTIHLEKETSDFSDQSSKKAPKAKKRKAVPSSLGLPDPAQAVSLPARSGKVTPLFNAFRPF